MTPADITTALVTETGPMALVVVFTAALAVGLAVWVIDFICLTNQGKDRDHDG